MLNLRLIFTHAFLTNFLIFLPFYVPYLKNQGLSLTQIFTLQSVFAITIIFTEFPTGVLSDYLGRKRTLVSGSLVLGLGGWFLYFSESFMMFVIFEFLMGFGYSLISGVDTALIYENEAKRDSKTDFSNLLFASRASSILSLIAGSALASYSYELALLVFAILFSIPFLCSLFIQENRKRKKPKAKNPGLVLRNIIHEFRELSPLVRNAVYSQFMWAPIYLLMVFTFQHIWQKLGISISWFGAMMAGGTLVNALTIKMLSKYPKHFSDRKCVTSTGFFYLLGILVLLPGQLWGIITSIIFFAIAQGTCSLTLNDIIHRNLDNEHRVTIDSFVGTGIQSILFIMSPLLGFILEHHNVSHALLILAIMSLFGILTVTRKMRATLGDSIESEFDDDNSDQEPFIEKCAM